MIRSIASVLLVSISATTVAAQEPVDLATIAKIKDEGLNRSQVLTTFNHFTNVIGPRLTATPAHKAAADWSRAQLERWGLSNARLDPFQFGRGWTLEKLTLEMTAPRYFPLIGFPPAWSPGTKGVLTGAPVYLGDKTIEQIRAMGDRLRGAIVLMVPPQPAFIKSDRLQPSATNERVPIGAPRGVPAAPASAPANQVNPLLKELGAGVILRPNMGEHGTIFVTGNRNTASDTVPSIVLVAEHYNMLVRMVQAGAVPQLRVELGVRYHEEDRNSYNVLAEIPGTDARLRDEIVLLSAHLDSWHSSNGATDNADGSASMMEAMRILKAIGAQPKRTIRLALWSGEEEGLLGSRAYADKYLAGDANAAAREKFYVNFNDDPGMGKSYGWYMEENAGAKAIFDAWLAPLKDLGAVKNVLDRITNTDHLSFTRLQLPAFTAIKDYVDYDVRTHHTNTDFYERVTEQDLKQSAIVAAVFAWHAANRTEKLPPGPPPPPRQ